MPDGNVLPLREYTTKGPDESHQSFYKNEILLFFSLSTHNRLKRNIGAAMMPQSSDHPSSTGFKALSLTLYHRYEMNRLPIYWLVH